MPGKTRWHRWKKGIYLSLSPGRVAALTSVCAGGIGCYVLYRNISSVGDQIAIGTNRVFQLEQDKFPYIYLPPNISRKVTLGSGRTPRILGPDEQFKGIWFPWLQKYSHDPWTLLRLTNSNDHKVRLIGVQALAQHHGWHDAEYLQLAQALDSRTMIALARSEGADPRFFLKPPRLPKNEETIEDSFRTLLAALPTTGIDACLQYFTSNALREGREGMADERGGLWCYGDSGLTYAQSLTSIPQEKMEMYCIEALLKHSLIQSHCLDIVNNGGLQLLQRLKSAHPDSPNLLQHVARIVRNLALHETLHQYIVDSGTKRRKSSWSVYLSESLKEGRAAGEDVSDIMSAAGRSWKEMSPSTKAQYEPTPPSTSGEQDVVPALLQQLQATATALQREGVVVSGAAVLPDCTIWEFGTAALMDESMSARMLVYAGTKFGLPGRRKTQDLAASVDRAGLERSVRDGLNELWRAANGGKGHFSYAALSRGNIELLGPGPTSSLQKGIRSLGVGDLNRLVAALNAGELQLQRRSSLADVPDVPLDRAAVSVAGDAASSSHSDGLPTVVAAAVETSTSAAASSNLSTISVSDRIGLFQIFD